MQNHSKWSAIFFRKRILMTFDHVRATFLYKDNKHFNKNVNNWQQSGNFVIQKLSAVQRLCIK